MLGILNTFFFKQFLKVLKWVNFLLTTSLSCSYDILFCLLANDIMDVLIFNDNNISFSGPLPRQ